MSDGKKPGFFERLFGGGGDEPPVPAKKEPPKDRPIKKESPERRRPPKAVTAKADRKKDKPKASAEPRRSWFDQLRKGLARTSNALSDNLAGELTKRKLDEDTLDRLEEVLIKADLGVAMAGRIRAAIAKSRYDRGLDEGTVREVLAAEVASVLEPVAEAFPLSGVRPHVVLVVGVNGTGKTTTTAKMAHLFRRQGLR
ncbi:MAG: signal recognition particle receptor subunit alpha, partial [Methyloceanibacter sp.]